ncbi:hypothetical protein F0562_027303 [Nyssa sinensis]|uniref:Uncharacterized protein n=1 Tax=Nyssa sinensis TaxID=561372 RepID=A0A5J5B7G4_9ASTE|nr:hypothetical protein F0562_027303 [Nyssa sinensis]
MPTVHSSPFHQMENPALLSLLQHTTAGGGGGGGGDKRSTKSSSGGFFRMFKLFPMLTSGCKMVALLGRPRKALLTDKATTGTLFGYRKGRRNGDRDSQTGARERDEDEQEETIGGIRLGCLLRGVSMGAGVLPSPEKETADGELTYMRVRFERVVGSKDSEALYMINPDGAGRA